MTKYQRINDKTVVELPPATRELFRALGNEISPELLVTALTHRSFSNENPGAENYERLEFLGDAVLELVVTETLYKQHPDFKEGQMANIRAIVVDEESLANVARTILHVQPFILLGHGEADSGGAEKSSILCDIVESLIGAVFLEHGIEGARRTVHRLIDDTLREKTKGGPSLDWKTSLTIKAHDLGRGEVTYRMQVEGPEEKPVYTAYAYLGDDEKPISTGVGPTKRKAQRAAAEKAWRILNRSTPASDK
ncbi:MAG: ribonuclease III [Bifidobacteriaceae bacterium]|nr:ribonuclease III [Bifidobacteriaceae bacterium]